jgi:hypothetical protein
MSFFKYVSILIFAAFLCTLYAVFGWTHFTYGEEPKPRYSPNCLFYVIKLQTFWEKLTTPYPGSVGTYLFDSSGKLLFSKRTGIDPDNGPFWSVDEETRKFTVYFLSDYSGEWSFNLKTSPDEEKNRRSCKKAEKNS